MKNLYKGLLVLFMVLATPGMLWAQVFQWAHLIRGAVDTTNVAAQTSATDATGNTYVVVPLTNSLRLGSLLLTGAPASSALIKHDAEGKLVWVKVLRGMFIYQLAADKRSGGIFLSGSSSIGAIWDATPFPLAATTTISYYAKCSADGKLEWAEPLPVYASASVADDEGNFYLCGIAYSQTSGTAGSVIGGTYVGNTHGLVLKADGRGQIQWVRVLHSGLVLNYGLTHMALAAKPGGGCVISGLVVDNLYLGDGNDSPQLTVGPEPETFITSFDVSGSVLWSHLLGDVASTPGTYYFNVMAVGADAAGNCYATGNGSGNRQLGGVTLPAGLFIVKYGPDGLIQWVRGAQPSNDTAFSGADALSVTSTGATIIVEAYQTAPKLVLGTLPIEASVTLVHYTAQGQAQWAVGCPWLGFSPYTRSMGSDSQGNLYLAGGPTYRGQEKLVRPTNQVGALTMVGRGVIVARLNTYANTLRGRVYLDQNGNGQREATEGAFPRPLSGALTQGRTTLYAPVGTDGTLQAYASPGPYTLSLAPLPLHYVLTQPTGSGLYTGTFSGSNQLMDGQDFGVAPVANQADLRVTLTPYSIARPGFQTHYRLTVENVGTTTVPAGMASIMLDAQTQFVSSTPAGTVSGHTVQLPYAELPAFGHVEFDVLFALPLDVSLGTVLKSSAAAPLAADVVPADNTASIEQTVRNSSDPNDLEVNYQRLTPAQLAAGQPLDYTVHFQNMGTDTAYTVVLKDTLDGRLLNLNTLQLVAQSHNCVWSLSDSGYLTVRFLNIKLPYQGADAVHSQGFVRFRVQPQPALALGTLIPNRGSIVFDYNAPISTNQAITAVLLATATAMTASHEAPAWGVYPNPATDQFSVSANLSAAGRVQLILLNALGQQVQQQSFWAPAGPLRETVRVTGLAPGVYLLQLILPDGTGSTKRIIMQ